MLDAMATSVSGIRAAETRIGASATNIANVRSVAAHNAVDRTGFHPLRVEQTAEPTGGTRAHVRRVDPPSVQSLEQPRPDSKQKAVVPRANVSMSNEMIATMTASHAFKSSLRALEAADEMLGRLVDGHA